MSRSIRRRSAASIGVLLLLALTSGSAMGHADGAVIQLSHPQIQPGATVTVHAQGMNPDEEITFELGDAMKAVPIGSAVATGDGFVDTFLVIPWQTPKGQWHIYARGTDGDVVSAPIVLAGVALNPDDEQGVPPDEEDPLIGLEPTPEPTPTTVAAAPAATFRPRTLPPQPIEAPIVQPPTPQPDGPGPWLVAATGGIGVVTLLVLALVLRRRAAR